jgi:MFS family permease
MEASSRITRTETKAPVYLSFRSSKTWILSTVALASFSDTFLYSIVVPVFPASLPERAHVAPGNVQIWLSILLAIYGGALLVAAPLTGFILDKCQSRKIPFLSGLLTLAAATAMLCVGNSTGLLIAGRALSGASAAIVWTGSAVIITANVDQDEVGKALGIVALALNIGSLAGPILGGLVYQHGGYYAVFGMAFGVLGADAILRLLMIEKADAVKWLPEETAVTTATGGHTVDLERNSNRIAILMDAEATTQTALEFRVPKKRLPTTVRLLSSYRILLTLAGGFVMASLLAAFETVLPLYVENEFHFSSTGAGLIFLPLVIPSLVDPLIGHLCDRHSWLIRYIAAAGFIGAICPLVLLRLVTRNSMRQIVLLCALLAIIGFCVAITAAPLLLEINSAVAVMERANPMTFGKNGATAQGYGLFICAFAGGSLAGPLIAGLIKDRFGWGTMAWVLGLLSGVISPFVLLWLGGWIGKKRNQPP